MIQSLDIEEVKKGIKMNKGYFIYVYCCFNSRTFTVHSYKRNKGARAKARGRLTV